MTDFFHFSSILMYVCFYSVFSNGIISHDIHVSDYFQEYMCCQYTLSKCMPVYESLFNSFGFNKYYGEISRNSILCCNVTLSNAFF